MSDIVLLLCAAGALTAPASAQVYRAGPQVVTYFSTVDDTDQPYGLFLPRNLDPAQSYPLVVSLHDAFSNHRLNLRRVFGKGNLPGQTNAEAARVFPTLPDVPFIVAAPLARGTMGYEGLAERDVYDVIDDVKKRFRIDDDRIYLTGIVMGGGGALWLALSRPDLWAAVAAISPTPPSDTIELAANAGLLPFKLFHGLHDPLVPVAATRLWHKRLFDAGTPVEYIEYPMLKHNAWDTAYKDAAIFHWFAQHRRNRFPDRVRFSTRLYAYRSAWWIHIDRFTPGSLATVDARIREGNRVDAVIENVQEFHVDLKGHPGIDPSKPVTVIVNGSPWNPSTPPAPPPVRSKGPGREGPVARIFAARHVYVYGTSDNPDPAEIARREHQAQSAAAAFREHTNLSLPVVADRDLAEEAILTANLILFGNRTTNRCISYWSDRLPLHLNPGAADYGLIYAADVGVTRVVVISGLPPSIPGAAAGPSWLPPLQRAVATLPDYVLFRGSLDNRVAEGYFDQNWRLPPDADRRLRSLPAITVNR